MALRAGSRYTSRSRWQGVIRDDSWPVYVCYHRGEHGHRDQRAARECAKQALAYIRENNKLPEGWAPFDKDVD